MLQNSDTFQYAENRPCCFIWWGEGVRTQKFDFMSGLLAHILTLGPGLKLLHVFSLMLTPGPSKLGVCTKTVAVYKASGESPSKQYWGSPAGMVISCCPLLEAAGARRWATKDYLTNCLQHSTSGSTQVMWTPDTKVNSILLPFYGLEQTIRKQLDRWNHDSISIVTSAAKTKTPNKRIFMDLWPCLQKFIVPYKLSPVTAARGLWMNLSEPWIQQLCWRNLLISKTEDRTSFTWIVKTHNPGSAVLQNSGSP